MCARPIGIVDRYSRLLLRLLSPHSPVVCDASGTWLLSAFGSLRLSVLTRQDVSHKQAVFTSSVDDVYVAFVHLSLPCYPRYAHPFVQVVHVDVPESRVRFTERMGPADVADACAPVFSLPTGLSLVARVLDALAGLPLGSYVLTHAPGDTSICCFKALPAELLTGDEVRAVI